MEIELKGQVKVKDWVKVAVKNAVMSMIILSVILIIVAFFVSTNKTSLACQVCYILIFVTPPIILLAVFFVFINLLSIHVLKSNGLFDYKIGKVTENGIAYKSDNLEKSLSWAGFYRFKTYRNTILLYESPYAFQIYSPYLFNNNDDWELFCNLVKSKVKKMRVP